MAANHRYENVTPEERFWRHVQKTDGCWEWAGSRRNDYAEIYINGRKVKSHRFSYELHYGAIPSGKVVCHACDNPRCVNPSHLFLGNQIDNVHDMVTKGRIGTTRLTAENVRTIRSKHKDGVSARDLANQFHVDKATILRVVGRRSWKHI